MAKTYKFKAIIERFTYGLKSYYVYFPYDVKKEFGVRGTVRVLGTLNGIAMDRALMPKGDGTHYILIPIDLRRKTKTRLGDKVEVTLKKNPSKEIELPEELVAALELDDLLQKKFEALNPGVRRSIAYWINSGKRTETRVQRAVEILRRMESGRLGFGA